MKPKPITAEIELREILTATGEVNYQTHYEDRELHLASAHDLAYAHCDGEDYYPEPVLHTADDVWIFTLLDLDCHEPTGYELHIQRVDHAQ